MQSKKFQNFRSIRCSKTDNVWKAAVNICPVNQWFNPGLKFCTTTYKCSNQSPLTTTSTPNPTTTTERILTPEEICEKHGVPDTVPFPDDLTCEK